MDRREEAKLNITEVVLEVKSMVDEMHGVVYRNGLVQSVKSQQQDIKEINDKLNSFLLTRIDSCPYKAAVDERNKKRGESFDRRLVVYGLIMGAVFRGPDLITWIIQTAKGVL